MNYQLDAMIIIYS